MSEVEISTTQQSEALETYAVEEAADEAQPTTAGQGAIPPPEEPPVAAASLADEPAEHQGARGISAQKLAANRANAQLSTGPKTPAGKEKSKFNALKHGLTARYFPAVIREGTPESEEYEAVRTDLFDHYQPQGPMEALLVAKISVEYTRYCRLVEREQGFYDLYRGFHPETLNKVARYQSAINRQLIEAIKELERVQAKRKAEEREEESEGGEPAGPSN